jgi:hypothetical protein
VVVEQSLSQGGIGEPLYRLRFEEAHVAAGIPDDLGLAPVFPDPVDPFARVNESIGDPGVANRPRMGTRGSMDSADAIRLIGPAIAMV